MKNCGQSDGLRLMLLENRVEALEKKVGLRALDSACDRLNRGVRNGTIRLPDVKNVTSKLQIIEAERQAAERRYKDKQK